MTNQSCMDEALVEPVEGLNWSNSDNGAFYEGLKIGGLKALAKKAGLENGCDMDILAPYWSHAKSILEVGAGYGRVINYLLKHQFAGEITAIECCRTFIKYLDSRFHHCKNVHLIPADILYLNDMRGRFDLILMLWSGMADFSPREERSVFLKLAKLLTSQGKLIIDALPASTIPLDMIQSGEKKIYKQNLNGKTIFTYSMSIQEIYTHAEVAGFYKTSHKHYCTSTGRNRMLYILE